VNHPEGVVNSLLLTEKQQEVLWLRYGRKASIKQIAGWLNITRRAVLSRLRNARRRTRAAGLAFPEGELTPAQLKARRYSASQISTRTAAGGMQMDAL
jgi:DNA-binding CsgD family transcriptional regulator